MKEYKLIITQFTIEIGMGTDLKHQDYTKAACRGKMQLHLNEISKTVAHKSRAVVLLDRAGWHTPGKLKVPRNLTIILLPSRSPELNPVENI